MTVRVAMGNHTGNARLVGNCYYVEWDKPKRGRPLYNGHYHHTRLTVITEDQRAYEQERDTRFQCND